MPLMMGETEHMLQKIESVYMYVNRIIQGGYNFRSNKTKVCQDIKVDLPRQMMCKAAVRFLHKHLINRKCDSILNKMIIPKRKISMIHLRKPQSGQYHGSLDKVVDLYNKLPAKVKTMTIRQFKKYMKNNDIKTQ